jgi:AraC-like DNA-binding protein
MLAPFSLRAVAADFASATQLPDHSHPFAQLIYAASGVMAVETPHSTWLVPPTRAIWVPAHTLHRIRMRGAVAMRTLYLQPARITPFATPRAIEVAPLLRELVLHLVTLGQMVTERPQHARLQALLLDLIVQSRPAPLELPLPRDARAQRLAKRLMEDPASRSDLGELARDCAASLRTMQRLFISETGLPLDAWRTRARMQHALVGLDQGAQVTQVALDTGYRSASAFITAFRLNFGVTPSKWRARS